MTMAEMETLQCRAGHSFERPRVRGKKPQWCPNHHPLVTGNGNPKPNPSVAPPKPAEETLQCREGHSWTRPIARGKKPVWCPEHRPVEAPKPERSEEERKDMSRAREAKATIRTERQRKIDALVAEILEDPRTNYELKLKLEYAHRYVDHDGMPERRDQLIREAKRRPV